MMPIPGRAIPDHHDVAQLSQELKLRLAVMSYEIQETIPEPGGKYKFNAVRPESRLVEIHDDIDEDLDCDIVIRILLENVKKSALWKHMR